MNLVNIAAIIKYSETCRGVCSRRRGGISKRTECDFLRSCMSRYDKNEEYSAASVHENKYFSELRRIEGSLIVTIAWIGCNKGFE